ncbi:MAG: hypothetical protein HEP71_06230 [Roseivirga sp.]|nr:hypothetical protein [Roseivirga sp.]
MMYPTLTFIVLCAILVFLGSVIYILKTGFNEIIKGLEVINEKLEKLNRSRENP